MLRFNNIIIIATTLVLHTIKQCTLVAKFILGHVRVRVPH